MTAPAALQSSDEAGAATARAALREEGLDSLHEPSEHVVERIRVLDPADDALLLEDYGVHRLSDERVRSKGSHQDPRGGALGLSPAQA